MKNVKILDCTLRDGGRIINCAFPDAETKDIAARLASSKIDIVEVGFLRDAAKVNYQGNSTFFTDVDQICPFVRKDTSTKFVAFIDYELYDFESMKPFDGTSIDGVRVGFTKKSFDSQKDDIIRCLKGVKEKGYMLFIQGVNSLGYSDKELLELLELVNEIHPDGFGIVDTYGAMYIDDVDRIYTLVDHNLAEDIAIDFHSHNNYQLSFAFAQEIIRLSNGKREIILDGTLNGMGKGAGNLNTELIVDYLVRKRNYDYDFDSILDIIDDYIHNYHLQHPWGYSIPALMGGVYKSHPNNIIYLTEKFRLATKDIKYIISMIDPQLRMRYDYDNIQRLYQEYNHTKVDDHEALARLKARLEGKELLLLLPGSSIASHKEQIQKEIEEHNLTVIMANFIDESYLKYDCLAFWGSSKRYERFKELRMQLQSFRTSNVEPGSQQDWVANYDSYIDRTKEYSDNTMLMLLRILQRIGITSYRIAGFDGFSLDGNYYNNVNFGEERFRSKYKETNQAVAEHLKNFADSVGSALKVKFLTPSIYQKILEK